MKDDIYVSMKNVWMVKNTNVAASSCLFGFFNYFRPPWLCIQYYKLQIMLNSSKCLEIKCFALTFKKRRRKLGNALQLLGVNGSIPGEMCS